MQRLPAENHAKNEPDSDRGEDAPCRILPYVGVEFLLPRLCLLLPFAGEFADAFLYFSRSLGGGVAHLGSCGTRVSPGGLDAIVFAVLIFVFHRSRKVMRALV